MTGDAKKTNPPEGTDAPAERTDEGSPPAASVAEPEAETPKGETPSPEKEGGPEIPEVLPLLPVRDIVIFPYMTLPLFVGREGSVAAVDEALARDRYIFLATQRDPSVEDPKDVDLYRTGTVAMIMRMLKLPDGRLKILIQGVVKAKIVEFIEAKPAVRVRIDRIVESPM
ncbi:MAG TPA: LON peptidase substrate-binding domain-containing protein, partial [Candidatus Deferrimicrobium sp.]